MDMIKCNKCGKTIPESNRYDESFIEFKRYKTACISKKFHLCADCDAELGKWLANKAQGGEIAIKPELTRKISEVIQRFTSMNIAPISQTDLIEAAIIGFLERMNIKYTDPKLAAKVDRERQIEIAMMDISRIMRLTSAESDILRDSLLSLIAAADKNAASDADR